MTWDFMVSLFVPLVCVESSRKGTGGTSIWISSRSSRGPLLASIADIGRISLNHFKAWEVMATVHSYARFSDPKQASGDSERRQDEALQKFVNAGKHILSDLQMIDKGKSGFKGDKQKALNEFLKILKSKDGRIKSGDILFVEAVDRLSRKGIRATQEVVNDIFSHGVDIRIVSPLEKTYRADAINDLGDAIELAAFAFAAHVYSVMLSKRVKAYFVGARKQATETGRIVRSGFCPFWLNRINDGTSTTFEWKPMAKETIQFIYQQTIDGVGGKRLCRMLNEKFECFGKGTSWSDRYLRHILNDRRAIGEFQPNMIDEKGKRVPIGDPIPNYFPQAVTESIWRKANAASRNRAVEKGPSRGYVNLWTGLIFHAIDKCSMQLVTSFQRRADGRKVIIRRLTSYDHIKRVKGASKESILIDHFEQVVLGLLKELDFSVFDNSPSVALEIQATEGLLLRKEARIREIQADESTSISLLLGQLEKLQSEVATLKAELLNLRIQQDNDGGASLDHVKFLTELEDTSENRQKLREAIKRTVRRIVILPVKLGEQKNSPIAALIEVELHNGIARSTIQVGGRRLSVVMEHDSGVPLYDDPKIAKRVKAFAKFMKSNEPNR